MMPQKNGSWVADMARISKENNGEINFCLIHGIIFRVARMNMESNCTSLFNMAHLFLNHLKKIVFFSLARAKSVYRRICVDISNDQPGVPTRSLLIWLISSCIFIAANCNVGITMSQNVINIPQSSPYIVGINLPFPVIWVNYSNSLIWIKAIWG